MVLRKPLLSIVTANNTFNMPRDTQRVFVGNLAPDVRPRDLEDFFKGYGRLGDISLKNGYGFVDFDDVR